MKALILSAGFGTRLKHYTEELPKALVPYKNVPMINYQLNKLKGIGVTEVIVNTHHHSDKIIDYFSKNNFGLNVIVIPEEEILGTGGGILNAKEFLEDEDFFTVLNVDIETSMNLCEMIEFHKSHNPFATMAVQKRKTGRYLEFDKSMNLLRRAQENSVTENEYAFNGIHIISKRIFEKGIDVKFEDILDIYFQVIDDKKEVVLGFDAGDSSFKDLGKIENLLS